MDDKSVKKGNLYSCMRCERAGKSYREARYRVVRHILKHHLSLDLTPFYCSLCMFRCTTADALRKHVTRYKRHTLMAGGNQVDSSSFLVDNSSAKPLLEGTDFRKLSLREQFSSSTSDDDPLNPTDEYLLGDFDSLDEQFHVPAPLSQLVSSTASSQGMINVQVTPEVLAQLMQQKTVNQSQHAPAQIVQGNQMYAPPPAVQRQFQIPEVPNSQMPPLLSNPPLPSSTVTTMSNLAQSCSSTPLLDEFQNTVISFPTPEKAVSELKRKTPRSAILNTPKGMCSPHENIMNQLLGNVPESPAFNVVESNTKSDSKSTAKVIMDSKAVQTELESESGPESKRPRREEDLGYGKALLETLGKITAAIDWNSRAIRNQDRTISQVVGVLAKLEKSVAYIANEFRKKDSSHRGKENSSPKSPNRKALKSTMKKVLI